MTIKEIAELSGVSPASVSLVINNKKGVSDATRERVKAVAQEQNYVPRLSKAKVAKATNIALVKFSTHGMIVEENQGFIAAIIDQIELTCRKYAFNLVMKSCNPANFADTISQITTDTFDGIILVGTELSEEQMPLVRSISLPLVVVDHEMRYENIDCVVMDNEEIAVQAIRYLYALGFREIGYLKSCVPISNFILRDRGYEDAMRRLELPAAPQIALTPTLTGSYTDMKAYLSTTKGMPHALFAANDTIAMGAVKALQESSYRVPADVSIIGIDDIPFSSISSPSLTTMRVSRKLMGVYAVTLLRGRIKHPDTANVRLLVEGQLMERESVRKAAKTDG